MEALRIVVEALLRIRAIRVDIRLLSKCLPLLTQQLPYPVRQDVFGVAAGGAEFTLGHWRIRSRGRHR